MKRPRVWLVGGLLLGASLAAQTTKEQPVGLVEAAQGAHLLRANTEYPLEAAPGDVLFAGDSLQSEDGSVTFLYCPKKTSQTLAASGEVMLEDQQLRVRKGSLTGQKPVPVCLLPLLERSPQANLDTYGSSLTRTLHPAAAPGTFESRVQALPEDQRSALLAALAPVDKGLAANPKDLALRVARATLLDQYHLNPDALEEFNRITQEWSGAGRMRALIHELQAASPPPAEEGQQGKTYALLVGISRYQRRDINWLKFADADAVTFQQYLKSQRGGSVPDDNVMLLTDEKATTAAIRNAVHTFLQARAGKKDSVILFIAAHGIVDPFGKKQAYIVTYDSDPQDLASTALPMEEIQELMDGQLPHVGRVMVYVDVCHSGTIGTIQSNQVNRVVERLFEVQGDVLGLMASRPGEYSWEGPNFGGGHGAFTYFLLKGLNGDADKNGDGIIDANETINYVQTSVPDATRDQQHPRENGNLSNDATLAKADKPGIQLAGWTPLPKGTGRNRSALANPQVAGQAPQNRRVRAILDDLDAYEDALDAGRILPETPGSAFFPLRRLQRTLPPEKLLLEENKLRVALENQGQQVLLRYLAGEQAPQTRDDFARGALYLKAARLLTPESMVLESKENFFEGRVSIFDKKYPEAVQLLERAARIDPNGAYSYNALGIAYLEQAEYERAEPAFREAIRLAPHWAYPRHNLALDYMEMGDYQAAIRSYQEAMRLAPQYAYLPYNLGLIYQRLNRAKDAEASYRKAIDLDPNLAEPYNALGSLNASRNHSAEAERLYRLALQKDPNLLAARHNLALLLARKKERVGEAIDLWRLNLSKSPDYIPSRLSLAETLASSNRTAEAVREYQEVLQRKPDYIAARIALAELLAKSGKPDDGLDQLRQALREKPRSPLLYEEIGDLEKVRGRTAEAVAAYESAEKDTTDPAARKQIRKKIKQARRGR